MKYHRVLMAVLAAILLVTAACGQATPQPIPVRPSRTPRPTFTPTVEAAPTAVIAAAVATEVPPTVAPSATPAPTAVPPTATPQPAPKLTAKQGVNIRRGPGTNYPVVGKLEAGQQGDITGKNDAGNWIQFNFNGESGWVAHELIDVTGDEAVVQVAQNIPAPPTAAPTARPQPRPTSPPAPPAPPPPPAAPVSNFPFKLTATGTSAANIGSTYVDGFVRHKDNSLYNGVCVHIAFYGPRNTKCSGCDGVGDGNWSFSPFGGPAPAGTTVEVFVVQCPGPLPHAGQNADTGFGNLTPVSDKWIHTFSQSEECHGVTFVGD